jgi:hypothetical protein
MSQPHGLPFQFQISYRKLIEYRSTPAEHNFSAGSVDLFSRGRFITETYNTSLAALFCTNKYEKKLLLLMILHLVQPPRRTWTVQRVRWRRLFAEVRFRSQTSSRGICGEHSNTGTHFSPSNSVFRCIYDPINGTNSANDLSPMLHNPCADSVKQ